MKVNLNNKKLKSEFNSENGELSDQTIFSYNQRNNIIWAEYSGGKIIKGSIIGKIVKNHLELVYQHINQENELMTGNCISYLEQTKNGKVRLNETWQWISKDNGSGKSTLIEI